MTKRKIPVHLSLTHTNVAACGALDGDLTSDINFTTCRDCAELHEVHEGMVDNG